MRAAYYEANGAARDVLRVGDVATPQPGPGEVRVRLGASGVNPSDVKSRAGLTRRIAFPRVVPHSDGAGEIDRVGPGVAAARVGERVWTWNGQWRRAFGTAAEYIVLPERQAVPLPRSVSFEIGAGIGIPAMTAWHAVTLARVPEGCTLFVPGGAGAVGFYAIQIAKMRGARVISSVSSDTKAEIAIEAGADHVIDYKREDVAARIADLTAGKGVDAVLEVDLGAGARLWSATLKPHARAVVYGTSATEHVIPAQFCLTSNIDVRFILVYEMPAAEIDQAIVGVSRMLAENRLTHNIGETFALADIVAAHEAVEQGATGKVVVTIS